MQMTFVPLSTISEPRVNRENCLSLDRTVTFTPLRPANFSQKTYSVAFECPQNKHFLIEPGRFQLFLGDGPLLRKSYELLKPDC